MRRIILLGAFIAALLVPATAIAQVNIGTAVNSHHINSSGQFCWSAWAFSEGVSSSGHEIGISWLHANACGSMRNIRGHVTCQDFRHWDCVDTPTFKVYRVNGHRHMRKLVGRASIARQISPGLATGMTLTTCVKVERGVGYVGKCRRIPPPPSQ